MKLLLLLIALSCSPAFAALPSADTVCIRYSFKTGDELTYLAVSHDSISMPGRETIVRDRKERVKVRCDSVSANGKFLITQTLTNVEITETGNDGKSNVRFETPWVGREVWFWMDSAGVRHGFGAVDTLTAGNSPGGAFHPHLLFTLKETCHARKSSWSLDTFHVDLPENSIPAPLMRYTSIFRIHHDVDTLGARCHAGQYTLTGQGSSHVYSTVGQRMRITTILAQFGKFKWSAKHHFPVHFFATTENKFSIHFEGDDPALRITGKHYINTNYTLIEAKFADGGNIQNKYEK